MGACLKKHASEEAGRGDLVVLHSGRTMGFRV